MHCIAILSLQHAIQRLWIAYYHTAVKWIHQHQDLPWKWHPTAALLHMFHEILEVEHSGTGIQHYSWTWHIWRLNLTKLIHWPGWGRTPTPSPMIRPVGSPLLQAWLRKGVDLKDRRCDPCESVLSVTILSPKHVSMMTNLNVVCSSYCACYFFSIFVRSCVM